MYVPVILALMGLIVHSLESATQHAKVATVRQLVIVKPVFDMLPGMSLVNVSVARTGGSHQIVLSIMVLVIAVVVDFVLVLASKNV